MEALAPKAQARIANMHATRGISSNIFRLIADTTVKADFVHFAEFTAKVLLKARMTEEGLVAMWAKSHIAWLSGTRKAVALKLFPAKVTRC